MIHGLKDNLILGVCPQNFLDWITQVHRILNNPWAILANPWAILGSPQSPLYKLHKDYPSLMSSTSEGRRSKIINHGIFSFDHFLAKIIKQKLFFDFRNISYALLFYKNEK